MPCSRQCFENSLDVNSPPLSDLRVLIFTPFSVSAKFLKRFDKSEILYSICRCSDLNNKLYITKFPLTIANIKYMWLSKGSNPREVATIIFLFMYIQNRILNLVKNTEQ